LALLRFQLAIVLALSATAATLLIAGCGSDESGTQDASVQRQIEAARQEGAEAVRHQQRLKRLERKVRRLEHRNEQVGPTSVGDSSQSIAESGDSGPAPVTVLRSFHTPSGNVSCEIHSDGAVCAVASSEETFAFGAGGPARIEPGTSLPPGGGSLVPYGTAVSAGSITCTVPPSDDPHGVICADAASGHGFEASRVPSRQRTY
jgi:hypothetical protein